MQKLHAFLPHSNEGLCNVVAKKKWSFTVWEWSTDRVDVLFGYIKDHIWGPVTLFFYVLFELWYHFLIALTRLYLLSQAARSDTRAEGRGLQALCRGVLRVWPIPQHPSVPLGKGRPWFALSRIQLFRIWVNGQSSKSNFPGRLGLCLPSPKVIPGHLHGVWFCSFHTRKSDLSGEEYRLGEFTSSQVVK